jgi:alpha-N-arabinofuranosidase
MRRIAATAVCLAVVLIRSDAFSRDIHVAETGSESGIGSEESPFRTICQAASVAQPGDAVIVHAGTYREWVKPPRGGTSEDKRITYCAVSGDDVFVKGSERITSWVSQGDGVWKVELPNSFFADYNPYALQVSGGWLNYGNWHHRGDVYLNGDAYYEKQTAEAVGQTKQSWHCQVSDEMTIVRANFGRADPNLELTEINVRESLFMPDISGLKYITVAGFHFMHAAANWAPPVIELQTGAIGPRMGKRWIIEHCTISDARCVGIILGQAPGLNYDNIDAYGNHVIRNNVIRRCGQAGIAGQKGPTRCIITGNLIEDTNYRKEFGGWETAAIKFHHSVDTVISDNLIRGVYHQQQGAFGIWIDFGNQGTRITRNVIYNTQAATVFLEMNHGPILVDNNVLIGQSVQSNSEATIFAHNLFVDCGYEYRPDVNRQSQFFEPHTTKPVGRKTGTAQDDKWFNNIFVHQGLDKVKDASGYESDYNVFLEGAQKSSFGDMNSVVNPFVTGFSVQDQPQRATVTFSIDDTTAGTICPLVNAKLVGVLPTVGQTIEDRGGNPITVNTDINGKRFSRPIPGPLADLQRGENVIVWKMKERLILQ